MKLGVVLFNLGGPDAPDAVEPFLYNLFSDPAIIGLPAFARLPLARWVAKRRAPVACAIYAKIGGRSPLTEETKAQADALDAVLAGRGYDAKSFLAMRYCPPFSGEAARALEAWNPDRIVLLPLYPQYSTTTTRSSLAQWAKLAKTTGLCVHPGRICCYPENHGFIVAVTKLVQAACTGMDPAVNYRMLFSAHGLPERTVAKGDPYPWQVQHTAVAIVDMLGIEGLDWQVCYQSRVGPLKWIGPATDHAIRRAGAEGKGVIVVPIAFVSEHSETLVELDIEYRRLACEAGVPDYRRVPTVGIHPAFISGLADLVEESLRSDHAVTCRDGRICPAKFSRCGFAEGS